MSTRRPGPQRGLACGSVLAWLLIACPRADGTPVAPAVTPAEHAAPDRPPDPAPPPTPLDPPRLLTDPGSGVAVVWAGAAMASAVAGAELVVIEPDLRHVSAYDWRTGEPRWRTERTVSAAAQLYGLEDRVLLHDRASATVLEAARGRVMGHHPAPASGRWPNGHAVEQRGPGACAWVGPCGIQAFDCSDGSPLGSYLASSEVHLYGLYEDPSEHDTECTPTPRLLGRHGSTLVLVTHLPADAALDAGAAAPGPALVGLHADTGDLRWHHALPSGSEPVGLTEDGACWVLDPSGPRLRVLEPDTGALRWERTLGPGTLDVHAFAGGLVVGREHDDRWRLSAYALTDGAPLWSARLAKRQRPSYPVGPIPKARITGTRRAYALIDPLAGRVVGELVAGREEALWRDPTGGFVLVGRDLREVDHEGRLVRQRAFAGGRVHSITSTHVLGLDGDVLTIFDREQLRERARLEGRLLIDGAARLPDDRLLLQRYGEDGVALVLGLEPPARGIRRGAPAEP